MINLGTLIATLAGVALLAKAGWDWFHGVKDVGRNLIVGLLCLGLGLAVITYEIATGSRDGMVGALVRLFTAILNNVAASFEASTVGSLATRVPTLVPTAAP